MRVDYLEVKNEKSVTVASEPILEAQVSHLTTETSIHGEPVYKFPANVSLTFDKEWNEFSRSVGFFQSDSVIAEKKQGFLDFTDEMHATLSAQKSNQPIVENSPKCSNSMVEAFLNNRNASAKISPVEANIISKVPFSFKQDSQDQSKERTNFPTILENSSIAHDTAPSIDMYRKSKFKKGSSIQIVGPRLIISRGIVEYHDPENGSSKLFSPAFFEALEEAQQPPIK